MSTCSRPGCSKKLRSNNTKGHCGSGCLSLEAPSYQRAKSAGEAPRTSSPSSAPPSTPDGGGSLADFRTVATALGKDPEALLAEFAESWLRALREKLDE